MIVKWKIPKLREDEKLEWMTPADFLSKVPHPCTTRFSALVGARASIKRMERGKESVCWDIGSYNYIKSRILNGEPIDALRLDYKRMWYGWPTHEGRHRALVCLALDVDKVPVVVRE